MKKVIILIIVLALIAVGIYIFSTDDSQVIQEEVEEKDIAEETIEDSEKDFAEDQGPNAPPYQGLVGPSDWISENVLSTYDATAFDLTLEQTGTKLAILYFYADWCPLCKAEFPELLSAMEEFKGEPVLAFRVNFKDSQDDEFDQALAKEHGVAYQHTKVFLKDGERILKNPETWNKDRYIEEITAALES